MDIDPQRRAAVLDEGRGMAALRDGRRSPRAILHLG